MPRRPDARLLEQTSAARPAPRDRGREPLAEPLAMLVRRGLTPSLARPDLPFDLALPGSALDAIAARARGGHRRPHWRRWRGGGDLDVVAAAEGKLLYLEAKSGPPKHLTCAEVGAFLRRVRTARPDLTLFVMDTALRLSDKVLPMFADGLARDGAAPAPPRRLVRETWALTPHLYLVSAKDDLVENACRAVADGLKALAPP